MDYYKYLNFNFSPLKNDIDPLNYLKNSHQKKELIKLVEFNIINPYFVNLLSNFELRINHVESFYRPPGTTSNPHIDKEPSDITKINWVYLGKDSKMNWLSLKPNKILDKKTTITGSNYYLANLEDTILEKSCDMLYPSLVQVGVLHNIFNPIEDRFCISFCFVDKFNKRLPFLEATKLFKEYILN